MSKYVQLHEQLALHSSPELEVRHDYALNLATALVSLWGASHNVVSYTKKEASLLNVFIDTVREGEPECLDTLKIELLHCLLDQRMAEWDPQRSGTFVTHEGKQYTYGTMPILRLENFKREDNSPNTRSHLGAMFHRIYVLYTHAQYDAKATLMTTRRLTTFLRAKERYYNPVLYAYDTAKILDLCFSYLEKSQRNIIDADTARTLESLVVCRKLYRPATRPFEVKLDSVVQEHLHSVRAYGLAKTAKTEANLNKTRTQMINAVNHLLMYNPLEVSFNFKYFAAYAKTKACPELVKLMKSDVISDDGMDAFFRISPKEIPDTSIYQILRAHYDKSTTVSTKIIPLLQSYHITHASKKSRSFEADRSDVSTTDYALEGIVFEESSQPASSNLWKINLCTNRWPSQCGDEGLSQAECRRYE